MVSNLIVRIDSVLTVIMEEISVGMSTYINIVFCQAPLLCTNLF